MVSPATNSRPNGSRRAPDHRRIPSRNPPTGGPVPGVARAFKGAGAALTAAALIPIPVLPSLADTVTHKDASLTLPEQVTVSPNQCSHPKARLRVEVPRGGSVTLTSTRVRHLRSGDPLYEGPYVALSDGDNDGIVHWRERFRICTTWPRGRNAFTIHLDPPGHRDSYQVRNRFSVRHSG